MASAPDHEEHAEQVPRGPGRRRSLPIKWTAAPGGVARARGPRGRLRRVEVARRRGRRRFLVGVGEVRGVRDMHAQPRDPGLSRPDHQPRRRRLVPDQRRPGQRPRSQQPEVHRGRQGVPRVVARRGAGSGAAVCPEDRRRGELGSLHALARPPGLPRPKQPGRIRQQQVRRDLARVPNRQQRLQVPATDRADTRCARKGLVNREANDVRSDEFGSPSGDAVARLLTTPETPEIHCLLSTRRASASSLPCQRR